MTTLSTISSSRIRRRCGALALATGLVLGLGLTPAGIAHADPTRTTSDAGDTVLLDAEDIFLPGWTDVGFQLAPVDHADWGRDVTGYAGEYYLDSWNRSDRRVGHLTSDPITVTSPYLNLLIGGGRHPHRAGGTIPEPDGHFFTLGQDPSFATFEAANGLQIVPLSSFGWTGTGDLAQATNSTNFLTGQIGPAVLDTCVGRCDAETGTISSPEFTITRDWINLLVGGGDHPWGSAAPTAVRLVVDGQTVRTATGRGSADLDWTAWDVRPWAGRNARIEVVDDRASSDWGHLMIDNVAFEDRPRAPWSYETSVVVRTATTAPDGTVVPGDVIGTVTGNDSATMIPATIDLHAVVGQQVIVQVLDTYSGSDWGHLMIDQLVLSAQPAVTP